MDNFTESDEEFYGTMNESINRYDPKSSLYLYEPADRVDPTQLVGFD